MERQLSIEEFINKAKQQGIELGKGNPYNRLRYYTKIGLLPHMIRKQDNQGNLIGHYPFWALARLDYIEKEKKKGLNNDEILSNLTKVKQKENLSNLLKSSYIKNNIISITALLLVIFVILTQLEIISIEKSKRFITNDKTQNVQILDSGQTFIPKGQTRIFIEAPLTQLTTKIYVSARGDYTPATQYYVSENDIEAGKGFFITFNAPTNANTPLDWWISQ
ncbi:MAG: hypothetical protein R3B92_04740 [Patescibacteria group bacterium]